jgi:hypothetical protein
MKEWRRVKGFGLRFQDVTIFYFQKKKEKTIRDAFSKSGM